MSNVWDGVKGKVVCFKGNHPAQTDLVALVQVNGLFLRLSQLLVGVITAESRSIETCFVSIICL